jgi:hypothetical protein
VEKAAKTIAKIAIRKPCEEENMYIITIHLKTMFNTTPSYIYSLNGSD